MMTKSTTATTPTTASEMPEEVAMTIRSIRESFRVWGETAGGDEDAILWLAAALTRAQADVARLDYLERTKYCAMCWDVGLYPDNGWTIDVPDAPGEPLADGSTLRDALDAAIKAEEAGK